MAITVLFGDEAMAAKIMNTDHPKDQKALGRKVRNFDVKKWGANCRDIVKRGNIAKVCYGTLSVYRLCIGPSISITNKWRILVIVDVYC